MRKQFGVLLAAAALGFSTGAIAGDGNTLRVIQTSPNGAAEGNSLSVDQSGASNSLVIGPTGLVTSKLKDDTLTIDDIEEGVDSPDQPAVQSGTGNTATVTITGVGGQLQLLQDNSQAATSAGNRATATIDGNGLGAVLQFGDNNTAELVVGSLGKGLIAQNGDGNDATVNIPGARGTGQIIQNGNNNTQPLTVNSNTTVVVTQNGNGLQPVGTAGIQVFSTNPGTISITQTGFR